ncbi:M14 family metallopeptidase [Fulvivirga lutea]|uniref:Zinc carboxypeptidase n=1 Tax=Fulvivirga lutea TaxID=2810512 RepID=A0A975A185_9BACT|nr:M14 family metallopeptidase [Fulvivirga lutea]QSE97975.1 zinc carboxypeptidase [Fulvivirga lutea]
MRYLLLGFICIVNVALGQKNLQTPSEFLGYELGSRFTRHHRVVEYFKHVADVKENVLYKTYGETYEHRPLTYAIISSTENIKNIEEIRLNNLRRTQLVKGNVTEDDITIVWLSYNIHGNEASSIEASMKTMYALADANNKSTQEWLKNTVVIIDPCVNPDGRDRYANFYNQYGNKNFNPNGDDIEHHEVWPGGRPNHYLFDLNRDWAWQTQTESASRSKIYHEWMPHVHVDYHEQFVNNPYYFAPAAEPFHEVITSWQREFQSQIGKNHAKYFDKENWLYFTRENFDLLYPSYGDTYPTYNGAIGMTYEQAGHGYAGLGIITEYGDTLTLKDRIERHYTTGISTVEIASKNAAKLSEEFKAYFSKNVTSPIGTYKSFVVKNNNQDKLDALSKFLDKHMIQYGSVSSSKSLKGYSYLTRNTKSFTVSGNDLVINTNQPASRLIKALFEPETKLSDTLTYDITAWSLPYAYGLDAYALTENLSNSNEFKKETVSEIEAESPYAYIAKYNALEDVKWLGYLLKKDVNVRLAHEPFTINGDSFERGSLVITQRNNEHIKGGLDNLIKESVKKYEANVIAVQTGFSDSGVDLGSSKIAKLNKPEIAVITGPQTSSLSYGEIWHFFEQQINYPITSISTDYFSRIDLDDYNVLIVPNGFYSMFDDNLVKSIGEWVSGGGRLILIGNAISSFKEKSGFAVKEYLDSDDKKKKKEPTEEELLRTYTELERDNLSSSIFGAIFKIELDNTHPLAYGYSKNYYSLKTSSTRWSYLEDGSNVGVIKEDSKPVSGFAGSKAVSKLDKSLVFGVQSKGRGEVVYLVDNPLFRGFWENGKLLFSNAVFMVGN